MAIRTPCLTGALLMGLTCAPGIAQASDRAAEPLLLAAHTAPQLEEIQIWGDKEREAPVSAAPRTGITALELESINLTTIEDAITYEPNVMVRRRFIGDANGTLGIRGANMFQTARTLVYADGLPLHYHLQTRWSGAPRWSLVAPDEVESAEVIYGPFSAAYSGNAMDGVVDITTRTPAERSVKLRGTLFNQFYQRLATEEDFSGGRVSASYGDTFGDFTVYGFYNHLENNGQPMTQYFARPQTGTSGTSVSGGLFGRDSAGNDAVYYGDSGSEKSQTDLLKFKTGYTWGDFQLQSTVAYEKRQGITDSPNNFLRDAMGVTFWGGNAVLDGQSFQVRADNFSEQEHNRESLLLGAALTGPLSYNWSFHLNLSEFRIIRDLMTDSAVNPRDPSFDGSGTVTAYDNTGWRTADFQMDTDLTETSKFTFGAHYSHYQLAIEDYASDNYRAAERTALESTSGGETSTAAVFMEYLWKAKQHWDFTLGARYEQWQAQDGFLDDEHHQDRTVSGLSPKFSLGYAPAAAWQLRYSLARALRFPLAEELYQNVSRTSVIQTADARLAPEDGIHHNLMIERQLSSGFARVNLFHEKIEDTIFNQLGIIDGTEISAFLAVDEVTIDGVELILQKPELFHPKLSMRFNASYLDATITRNSVNPAVEGNKFPRLPKWQSHLLLTYTINHDLNIGTGLRYASDSFGELSNQKSPGRTFGAHDGFLFLNLKANWQLNHHLDLALGVDNVTDEIAYVHHPWPSRTLYLEAGYAF